MRSIILNFHNEFEKRHIIIIVHLYNNLRNRFSDVFFLVICLNYVSMTTTQVVLPRQQLTAYGQLQIQCQSLQNCKQKENGRGFRFWKIFRAIHMEKSKMIIIKKINSYNLFCLLRSLFEDRYRIITRLLMLHKCG